MASLDISGLDELVKALEKAEAPEKIAKKAISEAEKELVKATRNAVKSALTNKSASGLVNAMIPTGAKENQWGVYSVVRPIGKDEHGIDYSQLALWLEYGRYRKGNQGRKGTLEDAQLQVAHPWRQKAINDSQAACVRIIEDVLEKELNSDG